MKKHLLAFTLLFFTFHHTLAKAALCEEAIEKLPLQQDGRIKPLIVHAQERLKFLTGSTSTNDLSASEAYCYLSLSFIDSSLETLAPLRIRIDHVETQKFLGLDKDTKTITPKDLMTKLPDMESYFQVLKGRGEDKESFGKDLNKTISRAQLYSQIIAGADWTIPVLLGTKDQESEAFNKEQIKWITLRDLNQIAPDHLKTADDLYSATLVGGEKFTDQVSNKHLLEYRYSKLHLFQWAMVLVLIALAITALKKNPRSKFVIASVLAIFICEIIAISFRVSISGRAPVTNMYETVMWVGLGALFFASILALIRQEKIFLIGGLILNMGCLFMMTFAGNMLDPSISPLVPVLRDNFWLSTHVTMVTISYAAFALSWVIANSILIKGLIRSVEASELKRLGSLCYDCLKIGVVLLAAGIILGGVWADYSWGRFWGWDPKETWSLIALMAYMAILHGRYSGWITHRNFIPLTALAFLTVIMAWFGVNYILATGLHSYGFSSGGAIFIGCLVAAQLTILALHYIRRASLT